MIDYTQPHFAMSQHRLGRIRWRRNYRIPEAPGRADLYLALEGVCHYAQCLCLPASRQSVLRRASTYNTHRGFRRSRAFWPFSSTAETVSSSAIGMLVAGRIFFFGLFSLFCPVCFLLSLSLAPLFAPPLLCSVACPSSRRVPLDFLGFGRVRRKPFCVAVWGVIALDWE